MGRPVRHPSPQRGSFLLEALVAILIVALGVLGLVGLQARAMQDTDESQFRGQAAFLTNDIISQMWTANQTTMKANFENNAVAGSPYGQFKTLVHQRLPGASDPNVVITARPAGGFDVNVTLQWKPPSSALTHQYQSFAVVGLN